MIDVHLDQHRGCFEGNLSVTSERWLWSDTGFPRVAMSS